MRHVNTMIFALVATVAGTAHAELMRSSTPLGIQVVGNTRLAGGQEDVSAISIGSGNTARNAAATVSGTGTNIRGDSTITATQKKASSVTYGRNNAATNEAGQIGGQ